MPDQRNAPEAPEGANRRKRVAPTIDLTATELPPSPVESAAPEPPAPVPREPEPVQEPPSDPAPPPAPEQEPPAPIDEPPPPPEEPPKMAAAMPPPGSGATWLGALASGIAGGAIVAIVLGALWYGGVLSPGAPQTTDASAQIAALQRQVQDLQSRPASPSPAAVDTKAIGALSDRVGKIENTLANLPKSDADIAQRLSAAENAMKSLGIALAALSTRSDDTAASAAQARTQAEAAQKAVTDLRGSVQDAAKDASAAVTPEQVNALQQRIAALEQSAKSVRRALSAAALGNAVASGAPFGAELAQAKALGADDKTVAPLAPFAATGVPSAAALAQELRALLPAMLKASGAQAPQGGFFERLQANASHLVRITPVDAPPGDDPSAVLARIDIAAAHADIPAALADLAKLPDAARAPALDWIKKAQGRQAALAAARDVAAASARSLSQP